MTLSASGERRNRRWTRDQEGSLPFALFITMIVVAIAGFLGTLTAWQVGSQQNAQADQEARWAAISALNIGIQKFATVTTPGSVIGRPDIPQTDDPAMIPETAAWIRTPSRATQLHWWAQRIPNDPTRILLHGEGRSGTINSTGENTEKRRVAISSLIVTLNYDYGRRAWVPDPAVRPWEPPIPTGPMPGGG